jgi:hypothetical protein
LARKFSKKPTKKSIVYSTVGLSLYPKPTISGIISWKYLDNVGETYDHLSAEAPIP